MMMMRARPTEDKRGTGGLEQEWFLPKQERSAKRQYRTVLDEYRVVS
jgi:hypothetical protein